MTGWNRCQIVFVGGFLATMLGCHSTPKTPSLPTSTSAPSSTSASNKVITVNEPPDDPSEKKDGPLATSSLLVFASTWVEAVKIDPNKAPPERERLLAQARQVYADVLAREPKNVEALIGLAQMYQVTGEAEKLAEIEKRMKEQHGNNAKIWAWIAVRQGQTKEWDAAAESYHMAAKLDPENRYYRIHLGFTLARAGRYEEGYAWLSRSMRETEARYNLAMMMLHNNHQDQAKQQLQFALQVDPQHKSSVDQLAALTNSGTPPIMTKIESGVRTVNYEEPVAPAPVKPKAPRPIPEPIPTVPPEPLPLGVTTGPRGPLPPAYTATTGWDTTLPPSKK